MLSTYGVPLKSPLTSLTRSHLDQDDDISILLLARLWNHGTGTADIAALTATISELLYPRVWTTRVYRNSQHVGNIILSRFLQGLGNPQGFCEEFIARFLRLPFAELPCYTEMFAELYHACQDGHDDLSSAFKTTMSHYLPFWLSSFALLRQMTRNTVVFGEAHHRIMLAIIGQAASCLYDSLDNPYRCEGIIVQWTTADILGTFDEILPQTIHHETSAGKLRPSAPRRV